MKFDCNYVSSAVLGSDDNQQLRYRYRLARHWNPNNTAYVLFIMLNPSTADATKNDPTITRCIGFAQAWGYGGLEVVNLFAWRATNPQELKGLNYEQAVGPLNNNHLIQAYDAAPLVVAAWGAHGHVHNRAQIVTGSVIGSRKLHVLGLSKSGQPRHPLYLRGDLRPQPWTP